MFWLTDRCHKERVINCQQAPWPEDDVQMTQDGPLPFLGLAEDGSPACSITVHSSLQFLKVRCTKNFHNRGKASVLYCMVQSGHRLYPRSHQKAVAEEPNGLCYSRAPPAPSSGLALSNVLMRIC